MSHATLASDTKILTYFPQNTRTHGRHTQHSANAKTGHCGIKSRKPHKIGKRGFRL